MRKVQFALLGLLTVFAAVLVPTHAQAYWRGGVWIGLPLPYVIPPPVYYPPPPVYYAPPPVVYGAPPVVYDPTVADQPATVGTCAAGAYVCPLARPLPVNSACSCPTNQGGRAGGIAR